MGDEEVEGIARHLNLLELLEKVIADLLRLRNHLALAVLDRQMLLEHNPRNLVRGRDLRVELAPILRLALRRLVRLRLARREEADDDRLATAQRLVGLLDGETALDRIEQLLEEGLMGTPKVAPRSIDGLVPQRLEAWQIRG